MLCLIEYVIRRYSVKNLFKNFRKIHKKTPVLDPLFDKVIQASSSSTGVFLRIFAEFSISVNGCLCCYKKDTFAVMQLKGKVMQIKASSETFLHTMMNMIIEFS